MISSRAADGHAGKMTSLCPELDGRIELDAGLAFDEHLRQSARGATRPSDARLEARQAKSGTTSQVNFTGCGSVESHMGTVVVGEKWGTSLVILKRRGAIGD